MSFSAQVKKELCFIKNEEKCCKIAQLTAIFNACGQIIIKNKNLAIKIQTENIDLSNKVFSLIKEIFNFDVEVKVKVNKKFNSNRTYIIKISDYENIKSFLIKIGFENLEHKHELIVSKICCKRAYIRGSFIAGGSITNPEKTYHIEFLSHDIKISNKLILLINDFEVNSKIIKRKSKYVVYIKEGEGVVDLLNIMGAHINLMELENIRIVKDVRNIVNRKVNCETANLARTVNASIKQIEDINYIKETKGLGFLDEKLELVAKKRLEYPNESLKQIGAMLSPPVGKSGVNHRLRKISDIAQSLRG